MDDEEGTDVDEDQVKSVLLLTVAGLLKRVVAYSFSHFFRFQYPRHIYVHTYEKEFLCATWLCACLVAGF